jgi:hypothetical protein
MADGRLVTAGMIYNPQPRDPDGEALSNGVGLLNQLV